MESQAKYRLVGTSVLVLSAGIVAAVLWLSEAGSLRGARYFTVYFKDHTLYGLQQDSYVTMRGIKVGSVKDLQISERNIEQIRVTLILDEEAPVKTDTVAMINRNLLTGFASIDLVRGTQGAKRLVAAPPGEQYPVIPEGKSDLDEITDTLPDLLEKVGSIGERISAALSEENIQSVSAILKNIEAVSETVAKSRGRIDQLFDEVGNFTAELKKLSKSVDDIAKHSATRLDEVSTQLNATLSEAEKTLKTLGTEGTAMMRTVSGAAKGISQDASLALRNISGASSSVANTLTEYQQPRNLITGPDERSLGPGEKRR